ncbi:MAG: bifunctional folylpolyglutamate synthase/dihydrofolate synthase [Candidatus Hydrogenedentes bacterium]|nr:bifunctional folylpolyglutamate synthase/dihydrofolate synthase [Candidatus Hydrogenedentota bacterium]
MTPREFLFSLERHGIKLGLDNIRHLLKAAGNPHLKHPTVHVAGTNGKGSVLAMLDAMLQAAGYITGRFTSPHLVQLNERFLIRSELISDTDLDTHLAFFQETVAAMDVPPTFFEVVTAAAFRWFAEYGLDLALIEVGLGGRFDSTNVITPLACAITNIDLEHTKYLGDTLEKIAFEKAGIIKPAVPVVVTETKSGPLNVILGRTMELGSPLRLLGRDFEYEISGDRFAQEFSYRGPRFNLGPTPLALAGRYQGENAAAAVALAELLQDRLPRLTPDAVAAGLSNARWPCRLERVLESPPVIMDVAHNAAGARKLACELPPCVVVLAVSSDKDAAQMLEALDPVTRHLILSQFTGPRALPVDQLSAAAGERNYERTESLTEAIQLGLQLAHADLPLVITGSIFTAGEARKLLIDEYQAAPLRF